MKRAIMLAGLAAAVLLAPAAPSAASGIRYYADPVYVKINKDDEMPMQDLMLLAERGDPRAQFIYADLYEKGKGGLAKNLVKARFWFESAARHGVGSAFIRLAAMAKHKGDDVLAYKWYTLSLRLAGGKEAHWSREAREKLVKSQKMGRDAVKEGEAAARAWLDQQRGALQDLEKQEAHARETGPAPDLGDEPQKEAKDAKDAKEQKEAKKDSKTAGAEPAQTKQEYRYNE